ncbi:MAG: DNA repair protein RecO [Patescibacteria group bacterium]
MHHIYHTEGIILGSKNFGEAGKNYIIFTRDLGMIYASAQGIRKNFSKLRFVLQDFNYLKIDLVRGKDFWRITSVIKTNQFENLLKYPATLKIFVNISNLLKRLLAGEESNEVLFNDLLNGFSGLEKSLLNATRHSAQHEIQGQTFGASLRSDLGFPACQQLQNIEIIIVLRILNNLGYIGNDKMLEGLIKSPIEEILFEVPQTRLNPQNKDKIFSQINKILKETHL